MTGDAVPAVVGSHSADAAGPSKVVAVATALDGVEDGMTVMVGGWGTCGSPDLLIAALGELGVGDLTLIMLGSVSVEPLNRRGAVSRMVTSFGSYPGRFGASMALERRLGEGTLQIELCSQGVLAERIRAGGAGIPAFYVEERLVGPFRSTDESREIDGKRCVLETALRADVALIGATIADHAGNLTWSDGERNVNEAMAFAADLVIVEAQAIYGVGALAPEHVMVPGLVVDRIVDAKDRLDFADRTRSRSQPNPSESPGGDQNG